MQGERQRYIAEFFGETNQNKDTLKHVLNECNDLVNVLEGLYRLIGGSLEEIATEKEYKLIRTCDIINQCRTGKCRVEEYDRIRRG